MEGKLAESVLKLERISFENINYSRNVDSSLGRIDYEINFTKNIQSTEDGIKHRVALTARLWSKVEGVLALNITIVGYFVCECEDSDMKETLVNDNTIAILFPYLRSQISLVTTQPDMPPITLPPMNIVEMFHESGK